MLAYRTAGETTDVEFLMLGLMAIVGVAAAVFVLSGVIASCWQLTRPDGGFQLSRRQAIGDSVKYNRGGLPSRVVMLVSAVIVLIGALTWWFVRSKKNGSGWPTSDIEDIERAVGGATSALLFGPYVFGIMAVGAIGWTVLYGRSAQVKWSGPYHVTKERRHHHRRHKSSHNRPGELVEPVEYSELESWSERPRQSRRRWFDPVSYETFGLHEFLLIGASAAILVISAIVWSTAF